MKTRLFSYLTLTEIAFTMVDEDSYAEECIHGVVTEVNGAPDDLDEAGIIALFLSELDREAAVTQFDPDPNIPADHPDNHPQMRAIDYTEREPLLKLIPVLRGLAAIENPNNDRSY